MDVTTTSHGRSRVTIQVMLGRQSQQSCRVRYQLPDGGWPTAVPKTVVWTCHKDDRVITEADGIKRARCLVCVERWGVCGVSGIGEWKERVAMCRSKICGHH